MRRTGLIALVAVAIILAAIVPLTRKSTDAIIVRHIQTVQSNGVLFITFGVTNQTSNAYIYLPDEVEARSGAVWKTCFKFRMDSPPQHSSLGPHSGNTYTRRVMDLPTGCPLRCKLRLQKTLTGLNGFLRRAELRFVVGTPNPVPLNPRDKNSKVFSPPSKLVSNEFTLPSPPPSLEPKPSADSVGLK